jgi:hypothetical protein
MVLHPWVLNDAARYLCRLPLSTMHPHDRGTLPSLFIGDFLQDACLQKFLIQTSILRPTTHIKVSKFLIGDVVSMGYALHFSIKVHETNFKT